jgi:hypothetical protein
MEWIKFTDKHPEENVGVLVTDGTVISAGSIQYYGDKKQYFHLMGEGFGGYEWEWDWGSDMNVTHWMEMPKLPSA